MLVNRNADRTWAPTDYPVIERSLFRNNETGGRCVEFPKESVRAGTATFM